MKTQLAWQNLVHNKVKTSVALAGVVFAIVLMFMQLGFLEAVKFSATLIYDSFDFDICLRSPDYLHLADARSFPRQSLTRARGVAGVASGAPVSVVTNSWRAVHNGERRSILCLAVAPGEPVFRDPALQTKVRELLERPDALLIDTKTRREYGPQDGIAFGALDRDVEVELSGRRVHIAGDYTCGAGLSSGGAAIISERGLQHISPGWPANRISLGLVHVEPGADVTQVANRLRGELGDDVEVLTRSEVIDNELDHWVSETNYGFIFQTGVLISLIVGMAIVYQVLASDVASLLPEYATLKAMGYENRYLAKLLLQQALALALMGFVGGVVIAELLYEITTAGAQIPVRMTGQNLILVLCLSVLMCVGSGMAALRKAFRADPAELF